MRENYYTTMNQKVKLSFFFFILLLLVVAWLRPGEIVSAVPAAFPESRRGDWRNNQTISWLNWLSPSRRAYPAAGCNFSWLSPSQGRQSGSIADLSPFSLFSLLTPGGSPPAAGCNNFSFRPANVLRAGLGIIPGGAGRFPGQGRQETYLPDLIPAKDMRGQALDNDIRGQAPDSGIRGQVGWLDELLEKIRMVESSDRLEPPDGDNGRAVGPLQLHKGVVDDVNKFFNVSYSYGDRRNLLKSEEITKLYILMWLEIHKEQIAALIFHYGPSQWKYDPDGYWKKIQKSTTD